MKETVFEKVKYCLVCCEQFVGVVDVVCPGCQARWSMKKIEVPTKEMVMTERKTRTIKSNISVL